MKSQNAMVFAKINEKMQEKEDRIQRSNLRKNRKNIIQYEVEDDEESQSTSTIQTQEED